MIISNYIIKLIITPTDKCRLTPPKEASLYCKWRLCWLEWNVPHEAHAFCKPWSTVGGYLGRIRWCGLARGSMQLGTGSEVLKALCHSWCTLFSLFMVWNVSSLLFLPPWFPLPSWILTLWNCMPNSMLSFVSYFSQGFITAIEN